MTLLSRVFAWCREDKCGLHSPEADKFSIGTVQTHFVKELELTADFVAALFESKMSREHNAYQKCVVSKV